MQSLWNCLGRATLVWVSAVVLSVGDSPGEEPGGLVGEVNKLKATVAELKKEVGTLEQTAQVLRQAVDTQEGKLRKTGVCIYGTEEYVLMDDPRWSKVDSSTNLRTITITVPSTVRGKVLDAWCVPISDFGMGRDITTILVRPGDDNRSVDVLWTNAPGVLRVKIYVLLAHPDIPVRRQVLWSGSYPDGRPFRSTLSGVFEP